MPKRKKANRSKLPEKNTTEKPRPVSPDVRERQDDSYTEDEFLRALDKGTRRSDRT